ncbi:MAG: hypothetical protein EG826_09390 [Deltaproteobacteria bacterium]|nr:hypothetical protein [Deltaproteobacteria bacterium]
MQPYCQTKKTPAAVISILAVLFAVISGTAAGETYQRFVMDQNYFTCDIPADWELIRDKDKDEDYKIYEIQLVKGSVSIYVSYYAADNADFAGYEDYIRRNSTNVLGETRSAREIYEPVKDIMIGGRKGFELSRERLVYLHPQSKSDESLQLAEKQYVLPAKKGFYVLHLAAPKAVYPESLPVLERIAGSFRPGVD